jgi:hypothetical protein
MTLFPQILRVKVVEAVLGLEKEVKIMQAGQLTIATPNVGQMDTFSVIAKVGEWMARVFGCWHSDLRRPFSHQGHAYRVCVNCGAQRTFNLETGKCRATLLSTNQYKPVLHDESIVCSAKKK